jgi:hypothetical protein
LSHEHLMQLDHISGRGFKLGPDAAIFDVWRSLATIKGLKSDCDEYACSTRSLPNLTSRVAGEARLMRILIGLIVTLICTTVEARVLTLSVDCSVPSSTYVPSSMAPFQLDWCNPASDDDVTQLLVQIADRWPGNLYVRAPSKAVTLVSDTIDWSVAPRSAIRELWFLEPTTDVQVRIRKPEGSADPRRMWILKNLDKVVIGGTGLRLTFVGTHPGLGTGEDGSQAGLLELSTSNGSTPALADIRANFERTWKSGVLFMGGESGGTGESTVNRFKKVNIAGKFTGSGVNVLGGVHEMWYDPQNTVISDPWNRGIGWDGKVARTLPDGTRVGCSDTARWMFRNFPPATAQYTTKVTGGITMEYGMPLANIFVGKYVGNGPTDPFVIRIKDWGFSGPTEVTGYPSGVMGKMVKLTSGPMKHDPIWPYEFKSASGRFIRFEQLPPTYGMGVYTDTISSGCAPDNLTNNNVYTSAGYIWQAEASSDGLQLAYVSAFVDVTFHNFTPWRGLEQSGEYVKGAGGDKLFVGAFGKDRTYGHVMRATAGTRMPGIVTMLDTNTVTGPGSWNKIRIVRIPTNEGGWVYPNGNSIRDTNVYGLVDVGDGATGTTIQNVNFEGAARVVLRVGAGSDVSLSGICVEAGATIEGAGTAKLNGVPVSLPYTFAKQTGCRSDLVPAPPEDVIVE